MYCEFDVVEDFFEDWFIGNETNYISELYGFLRILSSCINPILIFGCDFKITLLNTTGLNLPRRSREMSCTDIKGKVH